MTRLRLTYRLTEPAASMLRGPLAAAWLETFAEAGIALARPEGSRRPRIELGPALPPGATGERELLDAWVAEPAAPEVVVSRLKAVASAGLGPLEAEDVGERLPSLSASVRAARYAVTFATGPIDVPALRERIAQFLATDSLEWIEQRGERVRAIDLRAAVLQLDIACANGVTELQMRLVLTQELTGRPASVLAALGVTSKPKTLVRLAVEVDRPRVAMRAWREHGRFE
jgi:radical SAM-linked protein